MSRTTTQYRVVSEREGGQRSVKTYAHMKAVQDRIGRLTSPEPWRFWGDDSDRERAGTDYVCCAGTRDDECNCGGDTLAERAAHDRSQLPPLVSVSVQKRRITRTAWEDIPELQCGKEIDQ